MALFNSEGIGKTSEVPEVIIKSTVVVDRDKTISSLIEYIDGESWNVKAYYNSVKSSDDLREYMDTSKSTLENQYIKINNLLLKVTSALSNGNLDSLNGSAIIPANIKPMKGDMFTARLVSGEMGLFTIIDVKENSYKLDRMFSIEYKLDTTDVISSARFSELEKRVVKEFVYEEEMIINDKNPILLLSDEAFYRESAKWMNILSEEYYDKFINDNGYLLYTENNRTTLDPYVTTLFRTIVDLKLINDFHIMDVTDDKSGIIDMFLNSSVRITNHKSFIRPNTRSYNRQDGRLRIYLPMSINNVVELNTNDKIFTIDTKKDIFLNPEYGENNYLVNTKSTKAFNLLLLKAIRNEGMSFKEIEDIYKNYNEWNDKEMYWFTPLLLYIISTARLNMHSYV